MNFNNIANKSNILNNLKSNYKIHIKTIKGGNPLLDLQVLSNFDAFSQYETTYLCHIVFIIMYIYVLVSGGFSYKVSNALENYTPYNKLPLYIISAALLPIAFIIGIVLLNFILYNESTSTDTICYLKRILNLDRPGCIDNIEKDNIDVIKGFMFPFNYILIPYVCYTIILCITIICFITALTKLDKLKNTTYIIVFYLVILLSIGLVVFYTILKISSRKNDFFIEDPSKLNFIKKIKNQVTLTNPNTHLPIKQTPNNMNIQIDFFIRNIIIKLKELVLKHNIIIKSNIISLTYEDIFKNLRKFAPFEVVKFYKNTKKDNKDINENSVDNVDDIEVLFTEEESILMKDISNVNDISDEVGDNYTEFLLPESIIHAKIKNPSNISRKNLDQLTIYRDNFIKYKEYIGLYRSSTEMESRSMCIYIFFNYAIIFILNNNTFVNHIIGRIKEDKSTPNRLYILEKHINIAILKKNKESIFIEYDSIDYELAKSSEMKTLQHILNTDNIFKHINFINYYDSDHKYINKYKLLDKLIEYNKIKTSNLPSDMERKIMLEKIIGNISLLITVVNNKQYIKAQEYHNNIMSLNLINDIINDINIFFIDVNNTKNIEHFMNKIHNEILKINNKDILKTYLPKIKSLLLQNNVSQNLIDNILNNTV